MKQKLVVLTGAGISAESGIKTFRDSDGLWEGYDVMKVASPSGWEENYELVLDFYNQRRRQLLKCNPNSAHIALAELEKTFHVEIITQNVDDLHERAGSSRVLHLHGELLKARSTKDSSLVYHWDQDILPGMNCELGSQLRPHIVWFGEEVPLLTHAIQITQEADILLIVGTSLQVYPAAGLMGYAYKASAVYYIDPKPATNSEMMRINNLNIIPYGASEGMNYFLETLKGLNTFQI
jgi:NAD-dependent deacetylase